VGLVLAALAACGDDDGGSAASGSSDTSVGSTVRLLTHDSFAVSDEVLADLEATTGLRVEVLKGGDAGTLVSRAILTRGEPEGDVLFGIDDSLLAEGLEADLFEPYESPELAAVPDELELDPQHRVTPVDQGQVCVNVDREWFDAEGLEAPSSFEDLVDPAYRDLLVVQNPATSSPGLAFLLATIAHTGDDDDAWVGYWEALRDNGVAVAEGWEQAYYGEFSGGSGEGERPLVVSYATSPVAEVAFSGADPLPEQAPTGVVTATCYRQIEFAGVLAGAANPAGAQAVVDFLLGERLQADIPLQMFVEPVRTGVGLPEVFTRYDESAAQPLNIEPTVVAANRRAWVEQWTDTVVR
jgi:thiamine transport system substrate-binding protein